MDTVNELYRDSLSSIRLKVSFGEFLLYIPSRMISQKIYSINYRLDRRNFRTSPLCSRNRGSSSNVHSAFEIRPGFTEYRITYCKRVCVRNFTRVWELYEIWLWDVYNLCTLLWISGPLPPSIVATAIVVEDTLLESVSDSLQFLSIRVSRITLVFLPLFYLLKKGNRRKSGFLMCHLWISFLL